MKVRVITAKDCPKCRMYVRNLVTVKFAYEIYDGDAEENQEQLDAWKVEEFPVIQLLDNDGKLHYQFPPGAVAPRVIEAQIRRFE